MFLDRYGPVTTTLPHRHHTFTTPLPHLYHTVTRHQEILGETMRAVGNPRLDLAHEFDHVFWIGDLNCKLL